MARVSEGVAGQGIWSNLGRGEQHGCSSREMARVSEARCWLERNDEGEQGCNAARGLLQKLQRSKVVLTRRCVNVTHVHHFKTCQAAVEAAWQSNAFQNARILGVH